MSKVGFIGQGWIGKHYADDFANRGHDVVRYALEEPYNQNQEQVKECEIVFVAVPTPTTPDGFSYEPVRDALKSCAPGTTVIVKSTLRPGTTEALQAEYSDLFVMHSPEFLREASAKYDAENPDRNIIGIPVETREFEKRAQAALDVLPKAPYAKIMSARSAEMVKYAGNCFLYSKVVFMNILYDLIEAEGLGWDEFREAFINDPRIGVSHTEPVHKSGHDNGDLKEQRGAGGHCFIKDFEAFRELVAERTSGTAEDEFLAAMVRYNNRLLRDSKKDLDLLQGVYGESLDLGK